MIERFLSTFHYLKLQTRQHVR